MNDKEKIKKLAEIIENNPGCVITIDNDCWWIYKAEDGRDDELANSGDYNFETEAYGPSHLYGQGIMQVFLFMLRKQGFKIKMESV